MLGQFQWVEALQGESKWPLTLGCFDLAFVALIQEVWCGKAGWENERDLSITGSHGNARTLHVDLLSSSHEMRTA